MLSHSFDRFYVIMKFFLPTVQDLKVSQNKFDSNCSYLDVDINRSKFPTQYILNIRNFCKKIVPFIYFYKEQIDYYNVIIIIIIIISAHEILTKEISLDTTNVSKRKKEKRSIITLLVTSFIGLSYEGISSYVHNRKQQTLHKAFVAMENKLNLE